MPAHTPALLPVQAALLPFRLAHGAFGLACKAALGPLRAALGQRIPLSNRRHLVLVPERLDIALGSLAAAQERLVHPALPASDRDAKLVARVAERIISALPQPGDAVCEGAYLGHLKRCKWTATVLRSSEVNACVVAGGAIMVNTGLLNAIGRNEDKLAAVLGHEVAHVIARHSAEGIGLRLLLAGAGWTLCTAFGWMLADAAAKALDPDFKKKMDQVDRRYQKGTWAHTFAAVRVREEHERVLARARNDMREVNKTLDAGSRWLLRMLCELPGSRRAEREADLIGLKMMAKAGYDITRAPEVWQDFQRVSRDNDGALALLSTHPGHVSRMEALQEEVARMQALGWRKGRVPPATLPALGPAGGWFAL